MVLLAVGLKLSSYESDRFFDRLCSLMSVTCSIYVVLLDIHDVALSLHRTRTRTHGNITVLNRLFIIKLEYTHSD